MKEIIIKLRKISGLSQEELSTKLGMSRPTYAALEQGERDITFMELKKISEIFDIPMESLVDEDLSTSQKLLLQNSGEKSLKKFYNLILQCIKYGSGDAGKITKTKLAKLVYLCDFASYYFWLQPISGFEYRKLDQGPVAIEFFDMIDTNESINIEKSDKAMLVSLVEQPDDAVFDKKELDLIKKICTKWKHATTSEIVSFTHNQIPWKVCRNREVIPYTLINNEEKENVY